MSTNANIAKCPRCGSKALEVLKTHCHCFECLYFEDYYEDFSTSLTSAILAEQFLESAKVYSMSPKKPKKTKEVAS